MMTRNVTHDVPRHDDEEQEEHEPFNTPESSGERSLFITQPDPEPFHEDGPLSRAEKGKTPQSKKKSTSTPNVWQSWALGMSAPTTSCTTGGADTRATARRGRGTASTSRSTTRGRSRGSRGKRGAHSNHHIFFE